MMVLERLHDAEKELERARFSVEGTLSFIRFLERDKLEKEREKRR